jgi:hypothetical protein
MSSTRTTQTSDIGYAIQSFLHGQVISHVDPAIEWERADEIVQVDAADPDNLIVHTRSGAQFTIRIVRTG